LSREAKARFAEHSHTSLTPYAECRETLDEVEKKLSERCSINPIPPGLVHGARHR
jgi:hypothetical protein